MISLGNMMWVWVEGVQIVSNDRPWDGEMKNEGLAENLNGTFSLKSQEIGSLMKTTLSTTTPLHMPVLPPVVMGRLFGRLGNKLSPVGKKEAFFQFPSFPVNWLHKKCRRPSRTQKRKKRPVIKGEGQLFFVVAATTPGRFGLPDHRLAADPNRNVLDV